MTNERTARSTPRQNGHTSSRSWPPSPSPPSNWLRSWLRPCPLVRLVDRPDSSPAWMLPRCPLLGASGTRSAPVPSPSTEPWAPEVIFTRPLVTPTGMRRSPTWRMMIRRLARRATAAWTCASFCSQSGWIWSTVTTSGDVWLIDLRLDPVLDEDWVASSSGRARRGCTRLSTNPRIRVTIITHVRVDSRTPLRRGVDDTKVISNTVRACGRLRDKMLRSRVCTLYLNKTLGADSLVTAARVVNVGRVVLHPWSAGSRATRNPASTHEQADGTLDSAAIDGSLGYPGRVVTAVRRVGC